MKDFVFIHINKTGGSSIETALGLRQNHKTALEKRARLGEEEWERRFRFTIVRNPWDKVVSHYHFRVMTNQTGLGDHPIGFNEWVRRAYRDHEPQYWNKPKNFMPQWNWISDENGKLIINFIGRFENLADDFQYICQKINRQVELPHVKKSGRGHYREYYDEESVEIVRACFKIDIENLGYSF